MDDNVKPLFRDGKGGLRYDNFTCCTMPGGEKKFYSVTKAFSVIRISSFYNLLFSVVSSFLIHEANAGD